MNRKLTKNGPKMDHNIDHMVYECSLAPIHNPKNLMGINLMEEIFPELPQVAVFDTSFHVKSMPEKAFRYAIPENWYANHHVRRFGFHGTSHFYVAQEAERILQQKNLKIVSAHLGNGCSICAIKNGQSVDTSMGFSPLEGLMMGNRSGDIDPNLIPYISSKLNLSGEKIIEMLNYQSGFGAISGVSDSRDLEELYFKGENEKAIMAVEMFCYRIAKYISSYFAPLRCIPDALIFTAGIGERSPLKRKIITNYLSEFGFELDLDKNDKNEVIVSKTQSQKKIMVIPTNEELVIAQETYKIIE